MSLYDYGLGTLAQYELTADRSARTRGALLCYTAQGLLILREFHGSEKKLEKQQELLMKLQEAEEAVKDGEGWLSIEELKEQMGE